MRQTLAALALLALLALLAPLALPARGEGTPPATWEDYEKGVAEALRSEDPNVRARAFDLLKGCRDGRAVDLVVRSVAAIEAEQERIRKSQQETELAYEALFTKKMKADEWFENSPQTTKDLDRYNAGVRKIREKMDEATAERRHLENEFTRTKAQIDGAVTVLAQVLADLPAEDLTKALAFLDVQWVASKNPANPMRWVDAVGGVDRPTIADRVAALLDRPEVPVEVRAAALQTLGARKDVRAHDLALRHLSAGPASWDMASAAVEVLRLLHEKRCIEPLIEFLGREDIGRLREDAHTALKSLTGQAHGPYRDPWKSWWDQEKERFVPPEKPSVRTDPAQQQDGVTFYGIHTFSSRVLFVLDVSGSMDQAPKQQEGQPPQPPKIEVARKELLAAIMNLNEGDRFNVIFFNHEVVRWQGRMVEATEATKRRAKKWIEEQAPMGGTNIHDALEAAFGMALRSTGTPDVDTVFFLTDGRPTAGKIQEPKDILAAVAEWQKTARLRVHCVGIGDHDEEFVRAVATTCGGEYVKR